MAAAAVESLARDGGTAALIPDIRSEVLAAERRIRPYVRETFLDPYPQLSSATGASVYCKTENLQHTGSFKVRGALNRLLSMDSAELDRGIVAASTGNHGAAVAFGLGRLQAQGVVFVPETAAPAKVAEIERLGAEVRRFGSDSGATEVHAREHARRHGMTYLSPYNDVLVIGGQGTVAVELERQLDRVDVVLVSVGGGGLVSGVAAYLKERNPSVEVIGCSPENSRVMIESVRAGRVLDVPSLPTLSDGTAGGMEPGAITLAMCREWVDAWVTVTEDEIADSLVAFIAHRRLLVEGSAAVALAACRKTGSRLAGKNVVVVLCGGNVDLGTLAAVLQRRPSP